MADIPADFFETFDEASRKLADVRREVGQFVFGQEAITTHALTALLSGGHMLLIGVPGLAKTRLVSTLARVIGLECKRIQCTPDLMPSDIIGSEVLEEVDYGRRNFRFVHGPVFCQFLMVDEINRASPRTQSALLQAMQEQTVTVNGRDYTLPAPFHVLATQNPLEQEGTFPLPEAQLDRFLIQITVEQPSLDTERRIVLATAEPSDATPKPVLFAEDMLKMQRIVRKIPLAPDLVERILTFVRAGRPETTPLESVRRCVFWGPGPRASQALALTMRAHALLQGRHQVTIDDLRAMAGPVLKHRLALHYRAKTDGIDADAIIKDMLTTIA
ncbi:MAG: MoxR family ATPase [Alphaproteobacteria bacterium]|nr:MoxR family ATPase [Alphaproteobacteria bacterium]